MILEMPLNQPVEPRSSAAFQALTNQNGKSSTGSTCLTSAFIASAFIC